MKTFAFLVSFSLLGASGRVVNFDKAPIGKLPPGWSVAMTHRGSAPRWEVQRDGSAPTQPYVLAQMSNDRAGDRYPLAIFDAMNVKDGDMSVRIKPVAGVEDQSGGLVFRYRDPDNYYLARANALTHDVALFKVQNGVRIKIGADVSHNIPNNAWSILKVSARGNKFQIYVNHRRVLQAQDTAFPNSGKVGLWTAADAVTYFDDFRVYPK
jgi:hypothetical protein